MYCCLEGAKCIYLSMISLVVTELVTPRLLAKVLHNYTSRCLIHYIYGT